MAPSEEGSERVTGRNRPDPQAGLPECDKLFHANIDSTRALLHSESRETVMRTSLICAVFIASITAAQAQNRPIIERSRPANTLGAKLVDALQKHDAKALSKLFGDRIFRAGHGLTQTSASDLAEAVAGCTYDLSEQWPPERDIQTQWICEPRAPDGPRRTIKGLYVAIRWYGRPKPTITYAPARLYDGTGPISPPAGLNVARQSG